MSSAEGRHPPATAYPWHEAVPPMSIAAGPRATIQGRRAGLVTRSLANVVDLVAATAVYPPTTAGHAWAGGGASSGRCCARSSRSACCGCW